MASWPGRIPAGREVPTPAIAYDIFPTLLRLAGGRVPADRVYDGQDIWPLFCGEGAFPTERTFFWVYLDNVTALRSGRWKLHVGRREERLARPELYDVESDPGESRQVGDEYPDVVARLERTAAEFQATVPHAWRLVYPVRDSRKQKSGLRRK
jgi:arylsulfatase A-like enzyme